MSFKYRDWPKRIHLPDTSYFVTFYTKHRYPYFKESVLCDLFLENLKICKQLKGFLLFGWVIVYEHIHLLLHPTGKSNISEIMHCLKRHTSRDANIIMGYTSSPDVSGMDGSVTDFRVQPPHIHQGGDRDPHLQSGEGMALPSVRPKILSSPSVIRDSHPDVGGTDEGELSSVNNCLTYIRVGIAIPTYSQEGVCLSFSGNSLFTTVISEAILSLTIFWITLPITPKNTVYPLIGRMFTRIRHSRI
jgi:REP element-mobilizing transposase RayT